MDVTLDFETYYDKDVTLTKLSTPEYVGHELFCIHMMGLKINDEETTIVSPDHIPMALDFLTKKAKEDGEQVNLICQNVLFDGYILNHCYNWTPDFYSDTAAMSRGLYPHSSASLKNILARIYPDNPEYQKGETLAQSKGVKVLKAPLFNIIGVYCTQDVNMTYMLYQGFKRQFPPKELEIIHIISKMFCEPVFDLDIDLLNRYRDFLQAQRDTLIKAGGVSAKVLGSNKQFAEHLESLGLKPPMKVSATTGKPAVAFAKGDLAFHKFQKENPALSDLFKAREAAKSTLDISRTQRFIDIAYAANGKMPVALQYSAAHTHRLGGSDKTNLQNLTRNVHPSHPDGDLRPGVLRRALRAPAGQTVLVRDLSNIEARILAVIADQLDLVRIFERNGDPYAAMASNIYNREIDKKKDPLERNVGKVAVLGLGYGMSGAKFRDTLNSGPLGMDPIFLPNDLDYDRIVYEVYRKINTGITNFWRTCERFIYWMATADEDDPLEYKCLKVYKEKILLPNGLYLHYPNLRQAEGGWKYDTKNGSTFIYGGKLTENIVQALAQIVIKSIMLETTRRLPKWRVALQVHDETINIGPLAEAATADKIIEEIMSVPPTWMPDLPLHSEGGWAENYIK